jgi:hypothetical protein
MRTLFLLFLSLTFVACSKSPVPKGVLEPEEMEKVVYDLMQADEYINTYLAADTTVNKKERRSLYYEQIFKLHNTTRKDFYSSYKYYQQHPLIHKALFDSLTNKLSREKKNNKVTNPKKLPLDSKLM